MMEIQIEPHTLERAKERGASQKEIIDTLLNGQRIIAKHKRLGKTKIFSYNRARNEKFYEEKKLEVYYIVEDGVLVTVTVYVFYGKWTKK